MASDNQGSKRHFLLCSVCKRQYSPSVQLRQACMKKSTKEKTDAMVEAHNKLKKQRQWKVAVRVAMQKRGFYQRHALNRPLLAGFANHLKKDLFIENFKQEVENVARYLYFMNPHEATLQFAREIERTREYFSKLSEAGLSFQTVGNYLKNIKRFMKYTTGTTNLCHKDQCLYEDCKHFTDVLGNIQASISRQANKEIIRKRHATLIQGPTSPKDCLAVLAAAKREFLEVLGKLQDGDDVMLTQSEATLVLYYLEAIVVLRHLQRPGVVMKMTVSEWLQRIAENGQTVVVVKEHNSAASQLAYFALSQEEEMWFRTYYEKLRPVMLGKKRKTRAGEKEEGEGWFFISSTGNQIYNCSNDLSNLHKRYKLPNITSRMVRRSFETATKSMSDSQKSMVADYLAHSRATAERHYRMRKSNNAVATSQMLKRMAGDSDSGRSEKCAGPLRGLPRFERGAPYDLLIKSHPVTLTGSCPTTATRVKVTGTGDRSLYNRWRSEQGQLRLQHTLEQFSRHRPTTSRVRNWIEKQGWVGIIPEANAVVQQWKPSSAVKTALDSNM